MVAQVAVLADEAHREGRAGYRPLIRLTWPFQGSDGYASAPFLRCLFAVGNTITVGHRCVLPLGIQIRVATDAVYLCWRRLRLPVGANFFWISATD